MSFLISTSLSLFLLMDSIGNLPIYIALLKEIEPKRQRIIIIRELLIALFTIIGFYFLGSVFLDLLSIEQASVMIAGGIILFLVSIRMIFPLPKEPNKDLPKEEPFIVPLAIPLVAGPAILAAVMLYSHEDQNMWIVLSAIVIAWSFTTLVLFSASHLKKILGTRGIAACEKLMGLLLTLMAVDMFVKGMLALKAINPS